MRPDDTEGAPGMRASRWRTPIDALDAAGRAKLLTEVDGVLDGRIRDLTLTDRLETLYQTSTWHERAKRIRSWLVWVALLDAPICIICILQNPRLVNVALASHLVFLPIIYAALCRVMARPRSPRIEGLVLPIAVGAVMLMGGVIGLLGEGAMAERYLSAGAAVTATAIVIFPVRLLSAIGAAILSIGIYGVFSALNPAVDIAIVATMTTFYGAILISLIPARWSMNILHRHSFLLRLQSLLKADRLTEANARLAYLAGTDDLTGLRNRRSVACRLEEAWGQAARSGGTLGVALVDIDHFKQLNDTAGHEAGDRCLVTVAGALRGAMPEHAVLGRYGGEEFIVVLPEATPRGLLALGEAIREAVSALGLVHPGLDGGAAVSVSVGVAVARVTDAATRPESTVKEADRALYRAKAAGRNRVAAAWDAHGHAPPPARRVA